MNYPKETFAALQFTPTKKHAVTLDEMDAGTVASSHNWMKTTKPCAKLNSAISNKANVVGGATERPERAGRAPGPACTGARVRYEVVRFAERTTPICSGDIVCSTAQCVARV